MQMGSGNNSVEMALECLKLATGVNETITETLNALLSMWSSASR